MNFNSDAAFRSVASQKQGPGFESARLEASCVEFACSPCLYSDFFSQSKDNYMGLIGDSKLVIGVNSSVNVCLC